MTRTGADSPSGHTPPATLPAAGGAPRHSTNTMATSVNAVTGLEVRVPIVPGYEVLEELGRGGMGVVYKARHLRLNRLVALKVLIAGAHAGAKDHARFRLEAEAAAQLQHPNIVQVYEVGEADGLPYLALEFCTGGSLADRLDGEPEQPAGAALFVEMLAHAVAVAHGQGVVHRDLKPANVLLTDWRAPSTEVSGNSGESRRTEAGRSATGNRQSAIPKIADFGLAKRLDADDGQTATGAVMGTPSYMAPEQAAGSNDLVGPLADVYALGAILYELLTGRPPFRGASRTETLEQVRDRNPVSPRLLQPPVPRDLETICLQCLRKEPGQRYPSAGALADDLRRYLEGKPVLARRVGPVERGVKWVRRNPLVAGLVLTLLLAALGVSLAGLVAVGHAREQAAEHARLIESHQGSAEAALRRGAWQEALDGYERAEALGGPGSVAIQFGRARALMGLNRFDDALAILNQLHAEGPDTLGEYAGRVTLYRADLLTNATDAEVERAIRLSLTQGLPAADEWYARGMIADAAPESVACFKRALAHDHLHQQALVNAAILQVVLGEFDGARTLADEARLLFPQRVEGAMVLAAVHGLRHDKAEFDRWLAEVARVVGKDRSDLMRYAVDFISRAGHMFAAQLGLEPAAGSLFDLGTFRLLARIHAELSRQAQVEQTDGGLLEGASPLRLPLPIRRAAKLVQEVFFGPDLSSPDSVGSAADIVADQNRVAALNRICDQFPTGLLLIYRAYVLQIRAFQFETRTAPVADQAARAAWVAGSACPVARRVVTEKESAVYYREAADAYLRAYTAPSLIDVRLVAFHGAALLQGLLGSPNAWLYPDPEMGKGAAELVRRQLKDGKLPTVGLPVYFRLAMNASDTLLCRQIVAAWESAEPQSVILLKARAETEFLAENDTGAIKAARAALARDPNDPRLQEILRVSLKRVSEAIHPVPTPKSAP